LQKTNELLCFHDELLKGKEIGGKDDRATEELSVVRGQLFVARYAEIEGLKPLTTDNGPRTALGWPDSLWFVYNDDKEAAGTRALSLGFR